MATLEGLVEEMDQLIRVFRGNVLRLGVQGVRDGYGDGYVLAFEGKIPGRAGSLGLVLVRLEVVDNRLGLCFSGQRVCVQGAGSGSSCSHFSTTV